MLFSFILYTVWQVFCLVQVLVLGFFLRSLEYESLKIIPILEKVDQTFDLFSGSRKTSEVNLNLWLCLNISM